MGEILDLIVEYSKKGKILDEDYFLKVINILIGENMLNDYIKNVDYRVSQESSKDMMMGYHYRLNAIYINPDIVEKFYQDNYYKFGFYSYRVLLYNNIVITNVILHEIEHAIQFKNVIEKNYSFENNLIALGLSPIFNPDNADAFNRYKQSRLRSRIYDTFYDITLEERLANYHSSKKMLEILKPIITEIPNILQSLQRCLTHDLIIDYDFSNPIPAPTERYIYLLEQSDYPNLEKFLNDDFYKLLNEEKLKPLNSRLRLGLSISKEEYQKIKKSVKF